MFDVVTIARCFSGDVIPIRRRDATARLTTLPVSPKSSGLCQRETVNMPSSESRRKKTSQASSVYSAFSEREKAPAPVAAHVSIMDIWMTANFSSDVDR